MFKWDAPDQNLFRTPSKKMNFKINFCKFTSVLGLFFIIYSIFFSPVIFSDKLLAPGDGLIQNLPSFYSGKSLWTDLLFAGYPIGADPQFQMWYPISRIISILPNSWNLFIISIYAFSSFFAYLYIYNITKSSLAGFIAGISYGMSGCMIAHLGHSNMIGSASWLPLIILSIEKIKTSNKPIWLCMGSLAVALCILSGHPQVSLYCLILSFAYSVFSGFSSPVGFFKCTLRCLKMLLLGVGISFLQILPTAELSTLTLRSSISFEEFNSYSLNLDEAIQIIFPYLFGASPMYPYQTSDYIGTWGLTETTCYVGISTLLLSIIALFYRERYDQKLVAFWVCVALFTFTLSLGSLNPISTVLFEVPLYNKFRIPTRHFFEMSFAVSSLAGIGVSVVENHLIPKKSLFKITSIYVVCFILSFLVAILTLKNKLNLNLLTLFLEPRLLVPVLVLFFSVFSIYLYVYIDRRSIFMKLAEVLLVCSLIVDLSSFGWFYEWHYSSPSQNLIKQNIFVKNYSQSLINENQRSLSINGNQASLEEIPPNLNLLWNVPIVNGYNPLLLSRLSEIIPISASGQVQNGWESKSSSALDLLSVKYISRTKLQDQKIEGISWSRDDLNTTLGDGCNIDNPEYTYFPVKSNNRSYTHLGVVSNLGCSVNIENDTKVADIQFETNDNDVVDIDFLAGRDTSEWAHDCFDINPKIRHKRAKIFSSFSSFRDGQKCDGHQYLTVLPISQEKSIRGISIEAVNGSSINISKITLIDKNSDQYYPLDPIDLALSDNTHWEIVHNMNNVKVPNSVEIYKNLRSMKRAWIVPKVIKLDNDQILHTIRTGKLPDGNLYDPSVEALVEKDFNLEVSNFDQDSIAEFMKMSNTHVRVNTNSRSPGFLVLSDAYYPGWLATIDNKFTEIFQTNYVIRGIYLPEGQHVVDFNFSPKSFNTGIGVSVASLSFLIYYLFSSNDR